MIKSWLTLVFVVSVLNAAGGRSYTAASVEASAINAAIALCADSVGDTVIIPGGTATWAHGTANVTVNKSIYLIGSLSDSTIVNVGAGGTWTNGLCDITAPAVVKGIKFQLGSDIAGVSMISVSASANGFRITNCRFESNNYSMGYSIYCAAYGLIDSNVVIAGNETFFVRGPSNSWQTPSSYGTIDNLYVENNYGVNANPDVNSTSIFIDCNDNARVVFRYNHLVKYYFDGHGLCTNSSRSVRHVEVYRNRLMDMRSFTPVHMRGGTGLFFDNYIEVTGAGGYLTLRDYAYNHAGCANYFPMCACTSDYPLDDQIGVGADPKVAASEPVYLWNNKRQDGNIAIGIGAVSAACQDSCNDPTMSEDFFIKKNREYFTDTTDEHGGPGIAIGTASEMAAVTNDSILAFWVTDEGTWHPDGDSCGVLYKRASSAAPFEKSYEPYGYPYRYSGPPLSYKHRRTFTCKAARGL